MGTYLTLIDIKDTINTHMGMERNPIPHYSNLHNIKDIPFYDVKMFDNR
jgi:hypothetical protein